MAACMVALHAHEVASFREARGGGGTFETSLARTAATLPAPRNADYRAPRADEVEIEILKEGFGRVPVSGDACLVHHVGRLAEVGSVFDASRSKGDRKPFAFTLGAGAVVPAFEMAALATRLGGTTRVRAPARYAYGDRGVGKLVAPGAALVFDLTLVGVGDERAEDDPPVVEQLEEVPPWLAAIAPPATPPEYASYAAWRRSGAFGPDHPRFEGMDTLPVLDAATLDAGFWTGTNDVSATGLCVYRNLLRDWGVGDAWTWDALMEEAWAEGEWVLAKLKAPLRPGETLADVPIVELRLADFVLYALWCESLDDDENVDDARKDALPRFYVNGWEAVERLKDQRHLFAPLPPCVADVTDDVTYQCELATNRMIFGDKLAALEAVSRSTADASSRRLQKVFVGCGGSITRLHHDNHGAHAWLSMVRGRKLFVAFKPEDARFLHATGSHSPIDPLAPYDATVEAYPDYARATPYAAILEEGETILVPSGWWHYAASLGPSLTVMRNFWSNTNLEPLTEMSKDQLKRKVEALRAKGLLRKPAPPPAPPPGMAG